jgi:hypothetical protein
MRTDQQASRADEYTPVSRFPAAHAPVQQDAGPVSRSAGQIVAGLSIANQGKLFGREYPMLQEFFVGLLLFHNTYISFDD